MRERSDEWTLHARLSLSISTRKGMAAIQCKKSKSCFIRAIENTHALHIKCFLPFLLTTHMSRYRSRFSFSSIVWDIKNKSKSKNKNVARSHQLREKKKTPFKHPNNVQVKRKSAR